MGQAKVLSGIEIAKEIRERLKEDVQKIQQSIPGFQPGLAIVQVGDRDDSNLYVRMKMQVAQEIGIKSELVHLPKSTTEAELLLKINELNSDPSIHGIIVQIPLDTSAKIDFNLIGDNISPDKDIDGLNTFNKGRVINGELSDFFPCTLNSVIELANRSGIKIEGSEAVVLSRSKILGEPVAELLKWNHATVTVCHSKTENLKELCQRADLLVVGIGQRELVKGDWIKPGAVVIDCGINAISDPTKKSGQRIVGDVAYDEACKVASCITPVPGGVGPMAIAMMMRQAVLGAKKAVAVEY